MTKAVQQNPDQVGTRVKSTTQRRFGRAAAGACGAADRAGTGFPLAGPVVRTVLTESGCRIAPSTYYAARSRPPSKRSISDAAPGR